MPRVHVVKEIITTMSVLAEVEIPEGTIIASDNKPGGVFATKPEFRILIEDAMTGERVLNKVFNYRKTKPEVLETRYYINSGGEKPMHLGAWYYGDKNVEYDREGN